jgi:hypothetical protein
VLKRRVDPQVDGDVVGPVPPRGGGPDHGERAEPAGLREPLRGPRRRRGEDDAAKLAQRRPDRGSRIEAGDRKKPVMGAPPESRKLGFAELAAAEGMRQMRPEMWGPSAA